MSDDHRWEPILFNRLLSSNCTHVHIERAARRLHRSWNRIRAARRNLQRAKQNWYGKAPRPVDRARPFCFVLRRMKRSWRDADRAHDLGGIAVDRTIGATEARRTWSEILWSVARDDQVIRIRHQHRDEPAILVAETRFRAMEKAAAGVAPPRNGGDSPPAALADADHAERFLTSILGAE